MAAVKTRTPTSAISAEEMKAKTTETSRFFALYTYHANRY